MMSFDVNNINLVQLMQPELLTDDDIRSVLTTRCIRIDNIQNLNRDQLLSLFYRIATPLQQRSRNDNRKPTFDQNIEETSCKENVNNKQGLKLSPDINGVKKIKLSHNNVDGNKIQLKRTYSNDSKNDVDTPCVKKVRQKICWP